MAIDSVRLLTDSAAQLWRRLNVVRPLDAPAGASSFDEWLDAAGRQPLDQAEEQALRRDYRSLVNLLEELETLVRSRSRAIDMVRAQAAQGEPPLPARVS
jgi:hypothetical protein